MSTMKRVCIIDAKNQLYRMAAVNGHLSRKDGFPTGALFGCLNSTLAIASRMPDTSFVWVWDGAGETWRHKYSRENVLVKASFLANVENTKPRKHPRKYGYKANRVRVEEKHTSKYPQEGKARADIQIPIIRLVLEGSGFRHFQIDNLEGDDLIAMLTHHLLKNTKAEVVIHSGDKDFYQLLKHDRVKIVTRIEKGKLLWVTRKDVKKKFGVSVRDWAKYRAWSGDKTDNILHLRGVSEKVACKMLEAGFDPSKPLKEIDRSISVMKNMPKFERYFKPDGIERMWPFIQSNYTLSKLVTRRNDPRLPAKIQFEVGKLLEHVHFTRDKHKVTPETYRRVSYLLMQYQLNSILLKRDLLWRIP
jgi:5'-3' exonuclease